MKKKVIKEFKIRCSAIGKIMGDSGFITEIQLAELDQLINKPKARTRLQEEKMQNLIYKRDNPQISKTAKSYCQEWLKEQLYNSRKEFTSKETLKGLINEDESIDIIADHFKAGFLIKNEDQFEDDFMTGEPDVLPNVLPDFDPNELVIDAKNSWDCFTFPLFETSIPNELYYWQLQGYMNLCKRSIGKVVYTLTDTPESIIKQEATRESFNLGYGGLDMDILKKFYNNMTYKFTPKKLKIKVFDIERNDDDIQKIKDRVIMCREYIDGLLKQIKWMK